MGLGRRGKGSSRGENERVGGQRERRAEREKEEAEGAATGALAVRDPAVVQGGTEMKSGDGKTKIRGGRRVKVKQVRVCSVINTLRCRIS